MVLQYDVPIKLPIRFVAGSSIVMHINFTTDDFQYANIQLVDSLDEWFDIYSGSAEALMIRIAITPPIEEISFSTWQGSWEYRGNISPNPFPAGSTQKITFKALTNEMQILIDDVEAMTYAHIVPPEDARMLRFYASDMLLEKIEFIGN